MGVIIYNIIRVKSYVVNEAHLSYVMSIFFFERIKMFSIKNESYLLWFSINRNILYFQQLLLKSNGFQSSEICTIYNTCKIVVALAKQYFRGCNTFGYYIMIHP